jgi:hypothetical protein
MRHAVVPALLLLLAACAPGEPAPPPVVSPAADKLLEDVRILSADDMEGRLAGAPGGARARAYLLSRFAEIGLDPVPCGRFEHPFRFQRNGSPVEGVNLLGVVPGTGGSDRALLLMAHYDHVGVRNGQIFNGADDNASGVATVLKIAQSLKRQAPRHDVIIALVDAEEGGIRGSRAMVADPAFRPLLERIVLAVNLDMVSRNDRNELYAAGVYYFPWLRPWLDRLMQEARVVLKLGHDSPELGQDDWTSQSDHVAFHEIRTPWIYFGVEDHPGYHQPTDDFDAIPADFFRRSAETLERAVRLFDQDLEIIAVGGGAGKGADSAPGRT